MITYKFMVIKQILEPVYAQRILQWKIPNWAVGSGPGGILWDQLAGKGKVSVWGSLHWRPGVCWEKVGRLYLRWRRSWLCFLDGFHSGWSVGLRPESPRLGVTVDSEGFPEMAHNGFDHNATLFMQTLSARKLSWRCQRVSQKISTRGELPPLGTWRYAYSGVN